MKKAVLLLALVFSSLFLVNWGFPWGWDCVKGKGEVIEENIKLDEFNSFSIASSANVIVNRGKQNVTIKGQKNIIDLLERDVKKGMWEIDFEESVCINKEFTVYITIPDLETVSIDGSGNISSKSGFAGEDMNFLINGSGNIEMEVDAANVRSKINGSGNIRLYGTCNDHVITIAGSGDVMCEDMRSTNTDIKIMGSGDCEVNVSEDLDATIMGSGDVRYKGEPNLNKSIMGSGDIKKM
ncbi:MAG: head GIN domain-containing protein [Bacteroidota bacterium]